LVGKKEEKPVVVVYVVAVDEVDDVQATGKTSVQSFASAWTS